MNIRCRPDFKCCIDCFENFTQCPSERIFTWDQRILGVVQAAKPEKGVDGPRRPGWMARRGDTPSVTGETQFGRGRPLWDRLAVNATGLRQMGAKRAGDGVSGKTLNCSHLLGEAASARAKQKPIRLCWTTLCGANGSLWRGDTLNKGKAQDDRIQAAASPVYEFPHPTSRKATQ